MELLEQEGYIGRITYVNKEGIESSYLIARTTKATGVTPYVTYGVVAKKVRASASRLENNPNYYGGPSKVTRAEVLKVNLAVLESTEIKP